MKVFRTINLNQEPVECLPVDFKVYSKKVPNRSDCYTRNYKIYMMCATSSLSMKKIGEKFNLTAWRTSQICYKVGWFISNVGIKQ